MSSGGRQDGGRRRLELALADEEATLALGAALGRGLGPGAVVLLVGELGAGKTVLARGLARGLGVGPAYDIVSPTFTLLNIYPGRLTLFHADLFRLDEGAAAELELTEEAAGGVLAVEWAERAPALWPAEAVLLRLVRTGAQTRRALLSGPAAVVDKVARELGPTVVKEEDGC